MQDLGTLILVTPAGLLLKIMYINGQQLEIYVVNIIASDVYRSDVDLSSFATLIAVVTSVHLPEIIARSI